MTTEQAAELLLIAERNATAAESMAVSLETLITLGQVLSWSAAAAAGFLLMLLVARAMMIKNLFT